mgnify:CR=1 FL=1
MSPGFFVLHASPISTVFPDNPAPLAATQRADRPLPLESPLESRYPRKEFAIIGLPVDLPRTERR